MLDMSQQFALPVTLPDDETFESFWSGENFVAVDHIKSMLTSNDEFQFTYLFGNQSVGKSHLLYALCVAAHEKGLSNMLMPMEQLIQLPVDVVTDLNNFDLLCIDQIDLVAGNKDWERALFNLFNMFNLPGKKLVIAGQNSVDGLAVELEDLSSRLKWGTTFQLKYLSDDEKSKALQHRAELRGLEFSEEAARFLISRLDRKMENLIIALDKLDRVSMQKQRKLTIPFIKDVLSL